MRRIDSIGRVTIPADIRNNYNITKNTDLQVIDNGNGILILPSNRPYLISQTDMDALRKLYIMLNNAGLLDDDYAYKLSKITKETDSLCATCGNKMFLTTDNTYKCYKCE